MSLPVYKRPRKKAPKPFATINIVGKITDPENLLKIQKLYENHEKLDAVESFDDEYDYLSEQIEESAKKAGIK